MALDTELKVTTLRVTFCCHGSVTLWALSLTNSPILLTNKRYHDFNWNKRWGTSFFVYQLPTSYLRGIEFSPHSEQIMPLGLS